MRVALDFDGVCTDLAAIRRAAVPVRKFLYSPISVSMALPRPGILQLLSALGIVAELFVLSARPEEDREYLDAWLRREGLRHLVVDILCCGPTPKSTVMLQHQIALLVDDDLSEANGVGFGCLGIHWVDQGWATIARDAFAYLVASGRARIRPLGDVVLTGVELRTDWGSSHVFLLDSDSAGRFKLRVCATEGARNRLVAFLQQTAEHRYLHVARLHAVNGVAVLKSFLVGHCIGEYDPAARIHFILKTGAALASLHAIPCDSAVSVNSLRLNDEPESLLVCSADNHNLIVTPQGEVAFIDLGACASGSRWVDLCWANALLCNSPDERQALESSYLSASCIKPASEQEMDSAALNYQIWITRQLMDGLAAHSDDQIKHDAIRRTLADLWRT